MMTQLKGPMQEAIERANLAMLAHAVPGPSSHNVVTRIEEDGKIEHHTRNPASKGPRAGTKHTVKSRKHRYSLELKTQAVLMVKSGMEAVEVGKKLGVPYTNLYNWERFYDAGTLRPSIGWTPDNGDKYLNPNPAWAPTGPHLTTKEMEMAEPLSELIMKANRQAQEWGHNQPPPVDTNQQRQPEIANDVPLNWPDEAHIKAREACEQQAQMQQGGQWGANSALGHDAPMRDWQQERTVNRLHAQNIILRRIILDLLELQEL